MTALAVTRPNLWPAKDFHALSAYNGQGTMMPQSTHERIAELHNLAGHNHFAAAVAYGKGDHLTAHELSVRAHEHSTNAYKLSQELAAKGKL